MSTTVEHPAPAAGSRLVEFDEFIDYQLTRTSRGIRSTDLLTGIVGAALGTCAYLFLFILLDHWVVPGGFNVWTRSALWILGAAGLTAWITLRLVRPWRGKVNALFAAKQIEQSQPGLKSSLLTLIDLKQAGRSASIAVKTSLEKRTAVGLSKADVDEAIDRKVLMNCSYGLLAVLAVFCGYAVFSPKSIAQSAWRALVPFGDIAAATRTRIDRVLPGDMEVPAFSQVPIEVEISGQVPKDVTVLYTSSDRKVLDEPLQLRDTGEGLRRFRGTLLGEDGRGLRQTLTYRVVAGDAQSQEFSVRVVQPPSATMDEVAYQYPKYMGLAEKSETGGAIDGWEGTKVTLKATANMPVASAMALFSDSEDTTVKAEEAPLVVTDGTKLAGTWTLSMRSDGTYPKFYRVQVKTDAGHQDPQPALYPVRIRADQPPKIEVLTPKSDLVVAANGSVSVACRAADPDFQLQSVIMHFEREGRELPTLATLYQAPPNQTAFDGVHSINLSDFNLPVGGRLTWWLEARDNMQPFGDRRGNRSVTPKLNIDIAEPKPPEAAKKEGEEAKKGAEQALDQGQRENAAGEANENSDSSDSPMDNRDPMNQEQGTDEETSEKPVKPEATGEETLPEDGTGQESGDNEGTRDERPMNEEPGREDKNTEPGEKTGTEKKTPGQAGEAPAEPKEPGAQEKSGTKKPGDRGQSGDKGRGEKGQQRKPDARKQGGSDEAKAEDRQIQDLMNWANRQEKEKGPQGQEGVPQGSHDATKPPEKEPGQPQEQPSSDSERPAKEGRDQAGQRTKPEGGSEKGVKPPMKDAPTSKPKPPEGEPSKGADRDETPGSKASPPKDGTGEQRPVGEKATNPKEKPGSSSSPKTEGTAQDDATGEKNAARTKPKGADGEKPVPPKRGSKDPMTGEKATTSDSGGEQPKLPEGDQPPADGSKPMPNSDGVKPGDDTQKDEGPKDSTGQPKTAQPPQDGDQGSEKPAADGAPMKDDAGNSGKPEKQAEPKPGEENATAPDEKPMKGGESPRQPKTPPKETQNESADGGEDPTKPKGPASDSAKPSAAEKPSESESNQPADSQESTSGASDGRKQNSSPQSKSNENKGTGEKQPTGQADEGARSGGEGNPGSSSAGESGDQTEQGPGEPGKNGGKDGSSGKGSKGNSGAKGAGKGSSGEKGGESGDKPSESGSESGSESSANESSSSNSGSKDSDSSSKDGSKGSQSGSKGEPGGKGTASGEKDAPKQSGGESESGGENGTPADEPARPDQKPTKTGTGKNGTPTKEDAPEDGAPSSDEQSGGGGEKSKGGAKPNADKGGEKESGAGGEEKGGDQKGGSQKGGGDQQSGGKGQGKGGGEGEGAGKGGSKGQSNQSGAGGKGGTKAASGLGGPGQSGDAPPDPGPASEAVDDTAPHADEADLENRKKAVNLALKKLKETLERGSDQAVGEDLDVSDKELADFMRRLEERLADTGEDNSAEAQARRRQFDSILQSLKINGDSEDRKGDGSGSAASGFAAPRRPAPPEYRKAETQYKQRLSNQRKGAK